MKRVKLARFQHSIIDPGLPVHVTVAAVSRRAIVARQTSAAFWIVAAWLIGTLISELNVTGAELVPANKGVRRFAKTETLFERWTAQETEFAIIHSGIAELDRVQRNSELRILADSLIEAETARPGARSDESPGAEVDASNGSLEQEHPIQLAWKGFPEGSIPGLVELVVHSFQELMTPVHVRALASDDARVSAAQDASLAAGSVGYVDTDSQINPASNDFADEINDQPLPEGQLPAEDQTAEEPVQREIPGRSSSAAVAQIVRKRPQLLHVAAPSEMMPAPPSKTSSGANRETLAGEDAFHARSDSMQTRLNRPEIATAEARLAAKWPFDVAPPPADSSKVTLNVDNTDVRTVFEMLARGYRMNILVAPDVQGVVTANVEGLTPAQTLQGIVKLCDLSAQQDGDIIYIYPASKIPSDARQLRVFPLDFVRAEAIEPTVQGLLSPVGNAYPSKLDIADNMRTQESIVVVDIPAVIAQVENYILQADQAPRQVVIEARVLEVQLSDDMKHGINLDALFRRYRLNVGTFGLADPIGTSANPLFFARVEGGDFEGVIELLETTTDSKTLASPRVQVVNGQNARIQVGQQLGFTVATVTQTSTIQDVQFLETGVVLTVTPTISRDDRIMMQVKPEVSDGDINPKTLLPEEETREVETSVLLDNHQGVIIGGLIQEKDSTVIKKLPWLGDVKYIGKLFQQRQAVRSRSEIIVALVPHIVERCVQDERSMIEYERTETPLLQGVLQRTCRPWEPRLPDRAGEERHMDVNSMNRKLP